MFTHRWSARVSCAWERQPDVLRGSHIARCLSGLGRLIILLCPLLALSARNVRAEDVDTEHLFGFTVGSDVGKLGEKEAESETVGGFGKRAGSYAAISSRLEAKTTPVENLRVSGALEIARHDMSGVPDRDDRRQTRFEGAAVGVRYRLVDPERAPFGLTVGVEPHWNRVEEISGDPVDQYGVELSIAADKELVANRIYAAFNVLWEPSSTRLRTTGQWQQESVAAGSAALTAQLRPGLFVGAEVRVLRRYESSGAETLAGRAAFVGPTLYVQLPNHFFVSAAWNVQVAGRASSDPSPLDLANFERHRAMFRFGRSF
jgi:hypothetical protein